MGKKLILKVLNPIYKRGNSKYTRMHLHATFANLETILFMAASNQSYNANFGIRISRQGKT